MELIDEVKMKMGTCVEVTDLGKLHWLLGIEVVHDRESHMLQLSQQAYIEEIICHFNFDKLCPVSTPMQTGLNLSTAQSPTTADQIAAMCNIPFHQAISLLMYTSLGTQPNITFAVSHLSKFLQNPRMVHWLAAKHIFRYLSGTKDHWLVYGE